MTDPAVHLARINRAFARPIFVDGAVTPVKAILFHGNSDMPFSGGMSLNARCYEIPKSELQDQPTNGVEIVDGASHWRVVDSSDYDEADAWRVSVELVL